MVWEPENFGICDRLKPERFAGSSSWPAQARRTHYARPLFAERELAERGCWILRHSRRCSTPRIAEISGKSIENVIRHVFHGRFSVAPNVRLAWSRHRIAEHRLGKARPGRLGARTLVLAFELRSPARQVDKTLKKNQPSPQFHVEAAVRHKPADIGLVSALEERLFVEMHI
jgi:hypothetical protein